MFQLALLVFFLIWIDFYSYQAIKTIFKNRRKSVRAGIGTAYLVISILSLFLTIYLRFSQYGTVTFSFWVSGLVAVYLAKLTMIVFVFIDDFRRTFRWFFSKKKAREAKQLSTGKRIPRSQFLARTAVVAATLPIATMSFGILSGAYDYRLRRRKVYLPNLPKAFEGITIAQISDLHSGSFFDKKAVNGGVDMLLNEKPDLVFFTGDLVNNETKELNEYYDIFKRVKADLGVFSTLGNHDYGDYKLWHSVEAKRKNFNDMIESS